MAFIKIETENLGYAYTDSANGKPNRVLKNLDLEINANEYLLICGPSGCGKSTLLRTFNGLIPNFYHGTLSGQVKVAGLITARHSVAALFDKVGLLFQNPATQLFNSTVAKEIIFGLESLGLSRQKIKDRLEKTAKQLAITNLLAKTPQKLSGGQQQLVALAVIFALKPDIILLDEPYSNLDPANADKLRKLLKYIHQQGTGLVICEHRLACTLPDVTRLVLLGKGKIVQDGPPQKIINSLFGFHALELPLAIKVAHKLKLDPTPLDIDSLQKNISRRNLPIELRTVPPSDDFFKNARPLLVVKGLSYLPKKKAVLKDISFTLFAGECMAIVGPNGAGKTTLIKNIMGLNRSHNGKIQIMGQDITDRKVSQRASQIGIAFQNPDNQFFKLTVKEEIEVGAKILNRFDKKWIDGLIDLFRLHPLLERSPYTLSGGEKKRVAFAAALAARPAIFIMDEPTAGQDAFFRRSLITLIKQLKSLNLGILLITHDLAFAENLAGRWLVISNGQATFLGNPWQIMENKKIMRQAGLKATDSFRLFGNKNA